MKRNPASDEDWRSVADGYTRWSNLVANVDFRHARDMFAEDTVVFGTKVEMMTSREALERDQ